MEKKFTLVIKYKNDTSEDYESKEREAIFSINRSIEKIDVLIYRKLSMFFPISNRTNHK